MREAFAERSKMLVAAEFVDALLCESDSPIQEAHDLLWLLENVTGGANKRAALRWLMATITSLRFETEALSAAASSPGALLMQIADIYRDTIRAAGETAGVREVLQRLSDLGGRIEAEHKMVALVTKSTAPPAQKLTMLLKMAAGETAPPGPAADRAKALALKLAAEPSVRSGLSQDAETMKRLRQVVGPLAPAA